MYDSQIRLHNIGHNTWVSGVKQILDKSELAHLWDAVDPIKPTTL